MGSRRTRWGAIDALSPGGAQLGGWTLVAAVETAAVTLRIPWPDGGLAVRALHHLYDIGQILAVGVLAYAVASAWARFGPRGRWWGWLALWAMAAGATWVLAGEDLSGPARRLGEGRFLGGYLVALSLALGAAIPAAAAVGRTMARPRWRALAIAAAAAAIAAGCVLYPRQYEGLHFLLAWGGATSAGAALAGAPMWMPRSTRGRRAGLGILGAMGAVTLAIWPPNAVVVELFRSPGAVVAPFWARAFSSPDAGRPVHGDDAHWFVRRDLVAPMPASEPPLIPDDAIVFLLTVDAVRADVIHGHEHDDVFPTISRIRDEGVSFRNARATGSQTVYTITSLFAGTHFSQQYWSEMRGEYWPHDEPGVRFPEILSDAGVTTVTFASAWWLTNRAGVLRGFDEALRVRSEGDTPYGFTLGEDLIDATIERMEGDTDGPMFLYMHFMDPHAPYYLGGKDGTPFENYVAEIGYVDEHLTRLVDALEREGLSERAVILLTADHGEAFGEHDTTEHATTLYDELLRVPLLVYIPGLPSRAVAEPVSTIDLGPTILDLFGEMTPGHFMGQSLVPFLRGEDPVLTRPIVAEGRLMQAMVDRGGIKAIRDLRRNVREAYDLDDDPGELENLAGEERAERVLGRLARFFEVHTRTEDGYEVPFRP